MYQSKEVFLAELFKEMGRRGDFPAISESVWKIVAVMDRSYEGFDLTQAVLDDVALTQRVLREANSAMFARFGQNITTVTQAVVVLGYDRIGHLALGLKLTNELMATVSRKDERSRVALNRSTVTGTLSRLLARKVYAPGAEEAGVCGLLYGLSRVLVMFYKPEVWDAVESYMVDKRVTEAHALRQIVGLEPWELSQAVAEHWKMPERIVNVLALSENISSERLTSAPDHVHWLATLIRTAEQLRARLEEVNYAPNDAQMRELSVLFADRLGLSASDFSEAVLKALTEEGSNPLLNREASAVTSPEPAQHRGDPVRQLVNFYGTLKGDARKHSTRSLQCMTMEALKRIFGARRVALLTRDVSARRLVARTAMGEGVSSLLGNFHLEVDYAPDAFHLAIARNIPVFITEARKLREGGKLPETYVKLVNDDPAFLVIPFLVNGVPDFILYLDWSPESAAPAVCDRSQHVLGSIRDLLVDTVVERRAVTAP